MTSVLNLKPEIIEFNGSFVASLSKSAVSRRQLERMIESIRANGVRAVVTGIDITVIYTIRRRNSGGKITQQPASIQLAVSKAVANMHSGRAFAPKENDKKTIGFSVALIKKINHYQG